MQTWSKISRMPAQGIKKLQSELLEAKVKELAVRHPYYRSLFQEIKLKADSFSAADLSKLPFTVKEDILAPKDDPSHPKKFVLEALPEEGDGKKGGFKLFGKKEKGPEAQDYKLMTLYYTAGRTAKPVPVVYTAFDLENLKEAGLRAYDIWGMTRDDTMVNAFSFAPNVSFWQMYYSGMETGGTVLQSGGGRVLGMEKILRALNNMDAPVLAASPGYAQFALQTLAHFGFSLTALERIIIGHDYAPLCQVERLKKLMAGIMAKDTIVQRIYFLSEAKSGWAECAPGQGYHTNPDHVLVEIVDPQTGEVKKEGEAGEVVITNLEARGTVFLRFRTGDIATGGLTTQLCEKCGRTVPRILGDLERKTLFFDLQGANGPLKLNGSALRRAMIERPDLLQWYAELTRSDGKDGLKVVVKLSKEIADEQAFTADLAKQLTGEFKLPVSVETSSLAAIINKTGMERSITEQRIFDLRG
jgi:phenylacetate-coenzyme A ligase PaaK-like adenylate-forming protein